MSTCLVQEFSWVKRYYVLYGQSERAQARLDWYKSEVSYLSNPSIRKTIYLEQIEQVCTNHIDNKCAFELVVKHQSHPHKFSATDDIDLAKWVNHLKDTNLAIQREVNLVKSEGRSGRGACGDGDEDIYEAPPMGW